MSGVKISVTKWGNVNLFKSLFSFKFYALKRSIIFCFKPVQRHMLLDIYVHEYYSVREGYKDGTRIEFKALQQLGQILRVVREP